MMKKFVVVSLLLGGMATGCLSAAFGFGQPKTQPKIAKVDDFNEAEFLKEPSLFRLKNSGSLPAIKNNTWNLSGKEITSLEGLNVIDGIKEVHTLDLSHNQFEKFPEDLSKYMPALKNLNLSFNALKTVDVKAAAGLKDLETLDLSHNQLKVLADGVFADSVSLKTLKLDENQLEKVPAKGVLADLKGLRSLSLSKNKLSILSARSFAVLTSLESLFLLGNKLETVEAGAFNGLTRLQKLDLANNKLEVLQKGTLAGPTNLKWLLLDGNPLDSIEAKDYSGKELQALIKSLK